MACLQAVGIAWLGVLLLTRPTPDRTLPTASDVLANADGERSGEAPLVVDAARSATTAPRSANELPSEKASNAVAAESSFTPPAGTIVYGLIRGTDGRALRDAHVSLYSGVDPKPIHGARVTERASFTIAGVQPGSYELRARCDGYGDHVQALECSADAPTQRVDLLLDAAWILGVRLQAPDGRPLLELRSEWAKLGLDLFRIGFSAIATTWEPQGDFPPTSSREADYGLGKWSSPWSGEFGRIPVGCIGTLDLDEREPLWISAVLRHRILAKQRVEPGQQLVVFEIDPERLHAHLATLRVRVVDVVSKQPVEGARVELSDFQSGGNGVPTNAAGIVEIRYLRPGLLRCSCWKGEAQSEPCVVALEPGAIFDLGDIPIATLRIVKGRLDNPPADVRKLYLTALCLDAPPHPALTRSSTRGQIEPDGTFSLSLHEGRYLGRAQGAGSASFEFDTRALGDAPLVVTLAPDAEIRLDASPKGELLRLTLTNSAERQVLRRWLSKNAKYPIAVPPGTYRVEVLDRHGAVKTREIQVGMEGFDLRVPE